MMASIYDALLTHPAKFVEYFRKSDSANSRKMLLKTNRLRYWYCMYIDDTPEVHNAIDEDVWKAYYCRAVADRQKMYNSLQDVDAILWYCRNVRYRASMVSKLTPALRQTAAEKTASKKSIEVALRARELRQYHRDCKHSYEDSRRL